MSSASRYPPPSFCSTLGCTRGPLQFAGQCRYHPGTKIEGTKWSGDAPRAPDGLDVHLILDNYSTHKHATIHAWLAKHPRFHLHFTPTSSSWLNLVERWFRELTEKAPRRGVFHSVPDLIAAIETYLDAHNNNPKPFLWTATAEDILAKVARGRVALQQEVNQ
jgi:hypothetical protein